MYEGIYEIDADCPRITKDNWLYRTNEGWRWAGNIKVELVAANKNHIFHLQYLYGIENVTLGEYFVQDRGPEPNKEYEGVYIKDIPDLVSKFNKEMDKWDNEVL